MFDSGYFARSDDPITKACLGFTNRMMRSTVAACLMLFLTITVLSVCIWNAGVDFYVANKGVRETARIVDATRGNVGEGTTIRFAYRYGHMPDTLRIIEPWMQNLEAGIGECTLITDPRSCQQPRATVTVTYLPHSPGVYIVQGDLLTEFVRWIVIVVFLFLAIAAGWNLIRIGGGAKPLKLPTWAESGYN
ncbi:MAG: hypothetical protein AAGG44_15670 [Planctomycetota bacterium]